MASTPSPFAPQTAQEHHLALRLALALSLPVEDIQPPSDELVPSFKYSSSSPNPPTLPPKPPSLCSASSTDTSFLNHLGRPRPPSFISTSLSTASDHSSDFPAFPLSPLPLSPTSPSLPLSSTPSFLANPPPSPQLLLRIRYGPVPLSSPQSFLQSLPSDGQLPDSIVLSHHLSSSGPQARFAIQAHSWNRLLTYSMWHGNSRIEPAPLDVAEAEDLGLGPLGLKVFVVFADETYPDGPWVRLVMELSKSGPSPPPSQITPSLPRLYFDNLSNSPSKTKTAMVEIPKPYLALPLNLSALASSLHEIHRVAQLTKSCFSSSSLRPSLSTFSTDPEKRKKTVNPNTEALIGLAKWVASNSKSNGEVVDDETFINQQTRLFRRGQRWLRRHKLGSLMSSASRPSSYVQTESLDGAPVDTKGGRRRSVKDSVIDGVGLPLPQGANLIQPWDSDWV